ncbi:hypothetical protein ABZS76_32930 [Streptomyces sp. NPDC005562]|uniref:hypothetical protein n=1 Tax=Streptomyces sp. NPDC005562 TaxID=3154890 RepID=UPI0033B087D2
MAESTSDDFSNEVEQAVTEAQNLDGYKQQIRQEMRDLGMDVTGARIIAAHQVGGAVRTTEVARGQEPTSDDTDEEQS